jgi:hypothetical protein
MKDINSTLGNLSTRGDFRLLNESRQDEMRTVPENHPIHELWLTLSEIYGNQFVTNYGEEPTVGWLAVLDGMTLDQLATGLREAAKTGKSFAPNAVEFRALCGTDAWESKRMHRLASEVMAEPILDLSAPRLEDESNMDTGLMANIREADSPEAHLDLLKNLVGQTKGDR